MDPTVRFLLLEALARWPDHHALCIGDKEYTYQEFLQPVVQLKETLSEVFEGQVAVGVLADKTFRGYQAIATAFIAGKTYVPLSVHYPPARNAEIIQQSGVTLVLVDAASRAVADQLRSSLSGITWVVVGSDGDNISADVEAGATDRPSLELSSQLADTAYVLFTSGSTGKPKGVPVSNHNLHAYLTNICQVLEFRSDDRFSQFFDFTFDLSLHDMLVCWKNGACLCVPDKMAQLMPLQFALKRGITVWFSVPSLALTAKDLLRHRFSEFRLESLRLSLFCGEALPQTLAAEWSTIAPNAPVVNLYGPTEATIAFTAHQYSNDDAEYAVVPIGRPFGTNLANILDDNGVPAERAELCLGGEQVFSGYWQADHLTATAFHKSNRWYRTGDVVSQLACGTLLYHGRTDRQVQVNGFRVELQEVEHALRELLGAGTLAVIAYPLNSVGEPVGLTGFVGPGSDVDDLLESCKQRLPAYMLPRHLLTLNEFPYNSSGKLDYPKLTQIAIEQIA